ncbi:hypothetical protein M3Y98_01141600 [Aphelenchoides besseyi]|nr:hypothetical protein M3Y98_01141600 [Aphelenchoides besseyi]
MVNGRFSPCRNNFELTRCAEDCGFNCFAVEKTLQPLPEECSVPEFVVVQRSACSRLFKWAEQKSSSEHFATKVIANLLDDLLRAFSHGDDLHFPLTFNTPEESLLLYIEKVLAKTEADSSSKCWRWTGTFVRGGYAWYHQKFGKRAFTQPYQLAALLSPHSRTLIYNHKNGSPLDASHLCGNNGCHNPFHLCTESHRMNISRINCLNGVPSLCSHVISCVHTRDL